MVQSDDVDAQTVAVIGICGAIITFVLIVLVQVLYYRMERLDEEKKFVEPGSTEVQTLVAEQKASLNGYRWVDKGKGVVAIPIERAKELVVEGLRAQPGHA